MNLFNIIKRLYPYDYSIVGNGNDLAIKEFRKFLPFKVHNFNSGQKHNGWKIPKEWIMKKGLIKDENNKIIFDAKKKNLGFQHTPLTLRVK